MPQDIANLTEKLEIVKRHVADFDKVIIALSGGVDSTLILKICTDVLGVNRVYAVSVVSEFTVADEYKRAQYITSILGVKHFKLQLKLLQYADITENSNERCYLCKLKMFLEIIKFARKRNINHIIDGSNADDIHDFRPGIRALEELNIESPLLNAGINKKEVRILSRKYNLPDPERPSQSCLATRIPTGSKINKKNLEMIEKAESILRMAGFNQARVRHFDSCAIIEINNNQFTKLIKKDVRIELAHQFKCIGYKRVCLDLEGYRIGSMNDVKK